VWETHLKEKNSEYEVARLTIWKFNLNDMLDSQRHIGDKSRLGFIPTKKKISKTLKKHPNTYQVTCFYYIKRGHIVFFLSAKNK